MQWRRFTRISLRGLMVAMFVFCWWLSQNTKRAREQADAVRWVNTKAGGIRYDYEIDDQGRAQFGRASPVHKWLLGFFGVDFFHTVTHVSLIGPHIDDLSPIKQLPYLRMLQIEETSVSCLDPLASLKRLESLNAGETYIVDTSPLSGLRRLSDLDLRATWIEDVTPLAGLVNLRRLDVRSQSTETLDVAPLSGLEKLEYLSVPRYVKGLEIIRVSVPNCWIRGPGAQRVDRLPKN